MLISPEEVELRESSGGVRYQHASLYNKWVNETEQEIMRSKHTAPPLINPETDVQDIPKMFGSSNDESTDIEVIARTLGIQTI